MAKKTKKFSIYTIFYVMLFLGQAGSVVMRREPMTPLCFIGFALCLPAAIAPWFEREDKNIAVKAVSSLSVISFAGANVFLEFKPLLLVQTVLIVLFFAVYAWLGVNFKKKIIKASNAYEIFKTQIFFALFSQFVSARNFTFTESGIPFFVPAAAIGILIAGAIFTIFIKDNYKKSSKANKTVIFLIACFAAVFVTWAGIANLNYVLDFSEPEAYDVKIEDKDHVRRRKGLDWYTFTVTVNGKPLDIDVSGAEYNAHKIGDTYTVNRYAGAFGEPFFIAD